VAGYILPTPGRLYLPANTCPSVQFSGATSNVFVERLWRSLKYEEVYLKAYDTVAEARAGIAAWFRFYNHERPHQALDYRTPWQAFQEGSLLSYTDGVEKPLWTPEHSLVAAG